MELINFINQNATALMLLLNFALFVAMLYFNTKFAPKSLEAEVLKLQGRITRLEDRLDAMPSKEELHKLANSITELNGKIQSLEVKLGGAEDLIERVEAQSNRIDTYLRGLK